MNYSIRRNTPPPSAFERLYNDPVTGKPIGILGGYQGGSGAYTPSMTLWSEKNLPSGQYAPYRSGFLEDLRSGQLKSGEQEMALKNQARQQEMQRISEGYWNPSEYSAYVKKQKEYEQAQLDYNMKQLQFRNQALDWKKQMMGGFGFSSSSPSYGSSGGYSPQIPSYGTSTFPWKETSASRWANMKQNFSNPSLAPNQSNWTSYSSPQFPLK